MTGIHQNGEQRRLTVLLLEDDDFDAYITRRALSDIPEIVNVLRVSSGLEAMSVLNASHVKPDVCIVDLQMPVMNGREFIKTYTASNLPSVPLVVLTTSSDPIEEVISRFDGATHFICKRENPGDLGRQIRDLLGLLLH